MCCHPLFRRVYDRVYSGRSVHEQNPYLPILEMASRTHVDEASNRLASPTQFLSPSMPTIVSNCQQQSFPEPTRSQIPSSDVSAIQSLLGSFPQDRVSQLMNMNGPNSLVSPASLLPKQLTIEPQLQTSAAQCVLPKVENLRATYSNVSELPIFPSFPGREYSANQGVTDPQNNLKFGDNIDPTLMLQKSMSNMRNVSNENDTLLMHSSASNFVGAMGTDYPPSSDMTTSSCVDESGFFQSSENVEQANTSTGTFVKVMFTFNFICL